MAGGLPSQGNFGSFLHGGIPLYLGGPVWHAKTDWPAHLPWVLLGLHAAPKEISGFSSAEAVFCQPLVLPCKLIPSTEAPELAFKAELSSADPPLVCQPRTYAKVTAQSLDPRL
jgi:hypothetical protein